MPGFDALLPSEMARKAELIGAQKTRLDWQSLFVLAVLAGAFIGLGAMFATTVLAGAEHVLPFGVSRLLAGLVFCLGLVLVIVGGAELFTGNTLIVMAWAAGDIRLVDMLRVWLIVYVGNLVGAGATALLVYLSGQHLSGEGAVALELAAAKTALPLDRAFFAGILCNVLVCLAVWLCYEARTTSDKVLAIILPVSAFVAAGFEHSVASMYLIPIGLLIKDWGPAELLQLAHGVRGLETLTWPALLVNLVPVTIGNIVGGVGLVGAVYWYIYLRPSRVRNTAQRRRALRKR
jgi:formate/nitrite transporter